MTYRTTSLQQAAALMAQAEFVVDYAKLEPTEQPNKFKFVLEIHTEKEVFDQWIADYTNQKTTVEPKNYDSKINVLRDNLNLQKSRS